MKYKNLVLVFFYVFAFLFCFSAFIAWFVDPLKMFHKPFLCKNSIDDARLSLRYFIDNADFNSVILGTSMLENTSAKEANEKLTGKFINISMQGASFYERKIILNYLFKHKKNIKNILYTIDKGFLTEKEFFTQSNHNIENYSFLYDDNFLNDFKAYSNWKYMGKNFKTFFTFGKRCKIVDFDMPYAKLDKMKYLGGIENFAKHKENIDIKIDIESDKKEYIFYKENLDNNILYFAKKYPQTNFILIIPPYFIASNAMHFRRKSLEAQKNAIKYILNQNLNNIKIYSFDNMDFTNNIANYYDMNHYGMHINSKILDLIANDIGLLTNDNFELYWKEYEEKVKNFDLDGFMKELQAEAKKQKQN